MVKNTIVYILFLECCKHTDDLFWKSIFKDLAYGIPPYGTYISNDKLCCNYKGKEFIYNINTDKPSNIVYNEMHDIFNNTLQLFSKEETLSKKQHIQTLNNVTQNDWFSIKKQLKLIMIQKFCIQKKKQFKLSDKKVKLLYSIITIGLLFKTILPEHIYYTDNNILSIKGITFTHKSFTYNKSMFYLKLSKNSVQQIEFDNTYMHDHWIKFIQILKHKSKGKIN